MSRGSFSSVAAFHQVPCTGLRQAVRVGCRPSSRPPPSTAYHAGSCPAGTSAEGQHRCARAGWPAAAPLPGSAQASEPHRAPLPRFLAPRGSTYGPEKPWQCLRYATRARDSLLLRCGRAALPRFPACRFLPIRLKGGGRDSLREGEKDREAERPAGPGSALRKSGLSL